MVLKSSISDKDGTDDDDDGGGDGDSDMNVCMYNSEPTSII